MLDINRCPAAGVDSEVDQETSSADVFASVSCGIVTLHWQRFLHFRGSDGGNNVRKLSLTLGTQSIPAVVLQQYSSSASLEQLYSVTNNLIQLKIYEKLSCAE